MSKESKIGLIAAVCIGVNAMRGAGILAIPAVFANKVGPAGILTCLISSLMILFLGSSLLRVSEIYPGQGWSYLYPSKWAGHIGGVFSSICYFLGIIVAIGFVVGFAGIWFYNFIPIVSPIFWGFLILFILTISILAGTKISSWGQYFIAIFAGLILVIIAILTWFNFDPSLVKPFMPYGVGSVFGVLPILLFSYLGFESIISLYGVVENPKKNIPMALILSILIVSFIYIFFIYGILFAIPKEFFANGIAEPLSSVLANFFVNYKFLSVFVLICACLGMLGTMHSMIWSLGALLNSVVEQMKLNSLKKYLETKIWNGNLSIVIISFLMFLFSFALKLDALMVLPVFLISIAYTLSIIPLVFIAKEWKSGRNIITLLGLLSGLTIAYFALMQLFAGK